MSLTVDQKNILRVINQEAVDPIAAQISTALLSDAQAIAKISSWLPIGQTRWKQKQNAINQQLGTLNNQLNSINSIVNSIAAIQT